ncbi:MAG: DUF6273 domain-containing protein [Clostridiales bacterium]|nr:DUF6273 domain-containing protein [Clostridiales bacterium]
MADRKYVSVINQDGQDLYVKDLEVREMIANGELGSGSSGGTTNDSYTITPPTQSGTLTYNGESQSPTWNGFDDTKMTISGGETSATDAGEHTAYFMPNADAGYHWEDGTTKTVGVVWTIGKAELPDFTLSESAVEVTISDDATVTVTHAGDGNADAYSDDEAVATVSINGSTVTIAYVGEGSTTVHIRVAEGTNYLASEYKDVAVTAIGVSSVLDDNTWAVISKIGELGTQSAYWDVGDKKAVPLNGTVGAVTFSNETYYVFITDFNHNESVEGTSPISFQFGKLEDGTDIAFVDSNYNSTGSSTGYRMNTSNTNSGGWASSYMRGTILPQLLAALPEELQAVIRTVTKYSDNTGGGNDTASYVTATQDDLYLLAEFEVFGTRTGANSAEQNYQTQYQYYADGNSKIKYKHNDSATACYWWLRSVSSSSTYYFRHVITGGSGSNASACGSGGLAAGFNV